MYKKEKIFSSFSVNNLDAARGFYQNILGLETKENVMGVLELEIPESNNILIYLKEEHQPAKFTVLNFPVQDIDEAVDRLTEKGVQFEQYEGPIQTDHKGISRANGNGPDIAWFKDPAGNILSVLAI